jgi:hypothetical protein
MAAQVLAAYGREDAGPLIEAAKRLPADDYHRYLHELAKGGAPWHDPGI